MNNQQYNCKHDWEYKQRVKRFRNGRIKERFRPIYVCKLCQVRSFGNALGPYLQQKIDKGRTND